MSHDPGQLGPREAVPAPAPAEPGDLEQRRDALIMRDHILGLQAQVATAQDRAYQNQQRLKKARERLKAKDEQVKRLRGRVRELEAELAAARTSLPRKLVRRLRGR